MSEQPNVEAAIMDRMDDAAKTEARKPVPAPAYRSVQIPSPYTLAERQAIVLYAQAGAHELHAKQPPALAAYERVKASGYGLSDPYTRFMQHFDPAHRLPLFKRYHDRATVIAHHLHHAARG